MATSGGSKQIAFLILNRQKNKKKGELKTKSRGSIRSSVYASKYRRHHLAPGKSMEEAVRGLELAAWHGAAAFSKSSFKSRILSVVWGFPDS